MGLDMFVYTTAAETPAVDFPKPQDAELLHYWRKHPNLHGWMELLYRSSGGTAEDFNLVPVCIDAEALDYLAHDIGEGRLPETTGFFFGRSDGSEKEDDLDFIAKAYAAIDRGLTLYYAASW